MFQDDNDDNDRATWSQVRDNEKLVREKDIVMSIVFALLYLCYHCTVCQTKRWSYKTSNPS